MTYRDTDRDRALIRWLRWQALIMVGLAIFIFAQSYSGRVGLWRTTLATCSNGTLSRWQDYQVLSAQAAADGAQARDLSQSRAVRKAGGRKARTERSAARVKLLLTASTDAGREAYCRAHNPRPSPLG